jgi:hypothetical protein
MSWSFDGLKDGSYDIRARTFIRSTLPSLMNVSGIQSAPSSSYSDGSDLYLGWVLNNDKPYKVEVFSQVLPAPSAPHIRHSVQTHRSMLPEPPALSRHDSKSRDQSISTAPPC